MSSPDEQQTVLIAGAVPEESKFAQLLKYIFPEDEYLHGLLATIEGGKNRHDQVYSHLLTCCNPSRKLIDQQLEQKLGEGSEALYAHVVATVQKRLVADELLKKFSLTYRAWKFPDVGSTYDWLFAT